MDLYNKVRNAILEGREQLEEKRGLWDNIHAKRERIKHGSGEHMRKPGSKGAPTAADFKASQNEEVEQIDELSSKTLRAVGGRLLRRGLGDGPKAEKSMKSANLASAKLYPDQYKNSPLKAKVPATNEEVEQIDEVGDTQAGKRALGRYIKDRRGTILGGGMGMQRQNTDRSTTDKQREDLGRKVGNAFVGVSRAVDRLTKEETEMNNIEEGRGRPPKPGSEAFKRAQLERKKDPSEHIINRMGQAATNMTGGQHITYDDGKVHRVTNALASKTLAHYRGLKPAQKADFQAKIAKSHQHHLDALAGK